jgi:hypothetical protein
MARWQSYGSPPTVITVASGQMEVTRGSATVLRESAAALRDDLERLRAAVAALPFDARLEVEAALLDPHEVEPSHDEIAGRPKVARYYSDNLGRGASTWNVWLFGRQVIVDVRGEPRVECSFRELLATGLTAASAERIGPQAAVILDGMRRLDELPCMCGTGVERASQHGSLRTLASDQDPSATIEHRVTVARCTVCGRGWTFIESGDPHYAYRYEVRPFPPP